MKAVKFFIKTLWKTLFLITAGLVFAVALSVFITPEMINGFRFGISSPLLVVYAALIGFVLPGPRYLLYPVLAKLIGFGLSPGVIIALISGHVLIEPSTFFVEAGFFGFSFPLKRFLVSFIITICAGMLTIVLTTYCGWRIL